jgi:hypothetical protein
LILYLFIFSRSVRKTKSAQEWDLEWVSGTVVWRNPHYSSSRGRSRAPGARRGPQGAENRPKTRGRIYDFIFPQVFPGLCSCALILLPEDGVSGSADPLLPSIKLLKTNANLQKPIKTYVNLIKTIFKPIKTYVNPIKTLF